MRITPEVLQAGLRSIFAEYAMRLVAWHQQEPPGPEAPAGQGEPGLSGLHDLAMGNHLANFHLWHVEDQARRTDVSDAVIAQVKRRIDRLNQIRNDYIEAVDEGLITLLAPVLPSDGREAANTETMGAALDRLSILSLKIYHMSEQTERTDLPTEDIRRCQDKLAILKKQFSDLTRAVLDLLAEYLAGQKRPRVYRQFKMYNDPKLNPALYGSNK